MIKVYYTLDELISKVNSPLQYDGDGLLSFISKVVNSSGSYLEQEFTLHTLNINDFFRYKLEDNLQVLNSDVRERLMNLILLRYGDHYLPPLDEEITGNLSYEMKPLNEWAKKFIAVLFSTYDRYYNILNIYQTNINKLMDPLKSRSGEIKSSHREEDYDNDVTSKELFNDTPETTDVVATIEENQYVTNLAKGQAHTDNTGETNEQYSMERSAETDEFTIMNRIKEIQDSFQKVLYNWSREFESLFIEPLNV